MGIFEGEGSYYVASEDEGFYRVQMAATCTVIILEKVLSRSFNENKENRASGSSGEKGGIAYAGVLHSHSLSVITSGGS